MFTKELNVCVNKNCYYESTKGINNHSNLQCGAIHRGVFTVGDATDLSRPNGVPYG